MNTNHAKAIKGMSIANIVLGILTILGGMGGCAALGVSGAAIMGSGYDYIPLDDGTYLDTATTAGILGIVSIFTALAAICGILVMVAGIMGVRGADKPEKLKGIMTWNIVGAVASFFGAGIISLVLCIIVAVFANKDKQLAGAYQAAPAYNAYAAPTAPAPVAPVAPQAAAPVAPAAPAAPVAPQQPDFANSPVTPTTPIAADAVTPQQPAVAEVEAVAVETIEAADHAGDPAVVLPDNNVEAVEVTAIAEELPEGDKDKPQA